MKLNRQTLMERAGLREEDKFYDADKEQKHDEEDMPGGYDDDGRPLGEEVNSPKGSKARQLKQMLDRAINLVDENLGYKDLADAVALQLEDTYGEHNYKPFLDHLHKQLQK